MVVAQNRSFVKWRTWQSQAMRTTAWMQDDSKDAYTEVGGRATQEAKAEGGGRERPEHVLEVRLQEVIGKTTWMWEVVNVWNTFSNGFSGLLAKQIPLPKSFR